MLSSCWWKPAVARSSRSPILWTGLAPSHRPDHQLGIVCALLYRFAYRRILAILEYPPTCRARSPLRGRGEGEDRSWQGPARGPRTPPPPAAPRPVSRAPEGPELRLRAGAGTRGFGLPGRARGPVHPVRRGPRAAARSHPSNGRWAQFDAVSLAFTRSPHSPHQRVRHSGRPADRCSETPAIPPRPSVGRRWHQAPARPRGVDASGQKTPADDAPARSLKAPPT